MKYLINKIYIILILLTIVSNQSKSFALDNNIKYKSENISNYFYGIVSTNKDQNNKAFKHLKKVQLLKNRHSQFNVEFIRTLVLLEKFDHAFVFSKSVWKENELFFETDLLLGLNFFINKDYKNAEKHFERLNKISRYNLFFEDFVGNVLISWVKASQGNKEDSFIFLEKIPGPYGHLKSIQNIFLSCYFDIDDTKELLENLITKKSYNFSRYNFFLINYLLSKNNTKEAVNIVENARKKYNSNLLIKQTEIYLKEKKKKINNFFDCKNPEDSLAEFFYVMANLFASEKNYQMSNFYLRISLYLNKNFLTNKALLAENFFFQDKNDLAINVYNSIKSIGSAYSWYASKSIAEILLETKGKEYSTKSLQSQFDLLPDPTYENYYELADFYKQNEYYEESIKYYSLALQKIKKNHPFVPKLLDRRGTSFERLGNWESAEKDLMESLKILPNQAHVLNYLAYSWVDRGINLDKSLEMLKEAAKLKENDGYIIDSLGWAYYAKKDYVKAEPFLRRAVELLPLDPVINDHYADVLWMLNKNIQARHFWNSVLKLDNTESELKDKINKKLIFGIFKKL